MPVPVSQPPKGGTQHNATRPDVPQSYTHAARDWVDLSAAILLILLYVALGGLVVHKGLFIIPVILLAVAWLAWQTFAGRRSQESLGLATTERSARAWRAASGMFLVLLASSAPFAAAHPERLQLSLLIMMLAYIPWGLFVELLFQSIVHESLIRRGASPVVSVMATSLLFIAPHWRQADLLLVSLVVAPFIAAAYRRYRYMPPLGLLHGVGAGIVYQIILGHDPLARLLG